MFTERTPMGLRLVGRDGERNEKGSRTAARERLPFPAQAWREAMSRRTSEGGSAVATSPGPAEAHGAGRHARPAERHPAELALEQVERRFKDMVVAFEESFDDDPPRAA
jgi:hypothetical protein